MATYRSQGGAFLFIIAAILTCKIDALEAKSKSASLKIHLAAQPDIRASLKQHGLGKGQEGRIDAALYGHPGGRPAQKPARSEFVVAIPTHQAAEGRVISTRASRLGLRTFIATNHTQGIKASAQWPAAANETWSYYPDDDPVRSNSAGDSRAALVPFLAYKNLADRGLADFKWLFLGDDDTLFMVDAAREVAKTLDPEMPIFLTDNAWFSNEEGTYHPHKDALRCVPCNYARNMSLLPMNMTRGCPCTPEVMCALENGYNGVINPKACGPPRSPGRPYSMHGGSGALFSIGLLRNVAFEDLEECVLSQWNTGADAFLTICLWQLGYAMTDPDPLYHPEGMAIFDPIPAPYGVDEHILHKASRFLGNLLRLSTGFCSGLCELEHEHTVSLHMRAIKARDPLDTPGSHGEGEEDMEATARAILRALSRFYAVQTGTIESVDGLAWPTDCQDARETGVVQQSGERLEAALELVRDMQALFQVDPAVREAVAGLDSLLTPRSTGTELSVLESARSGAASAVAMQVLQLITDDAGVLAVNASQSLG